MEIRGRNKINPNFNMSSMTDIVFLLLIFFVWTSSFELPEFDLPSGGPTVWLLRRLAGWTLDQGNP